jgi:hypothetical protein
MRSLRTVLRDRCRAGDLLAVLMVCGLACGAGMPATGPRRAAHPANAVPKYAGDAACRECHAAITKNQQATGMGQAAAEAAHCDILLAHSVLTWQDGPYTIRIQRNGEGALYSATDGKASVSAPVRWAFGLGSAGQTYILEKNGTYYESRASYFTESGGLDLTLGHAAEPGATVQEELGRAIPQSELTKCFSCHTSGDIVDGRLAIQRVHPGVSCENCHGPAAEHVLQMEMSRAHATGADIVNPGKLAPAGINDFCGRCHRSTREVLALNIRDVRNVRFQPYRLENSQCYDPTDARIACLACHDPHQNLVKDPGAYDAKCLACHAAQSGRRSTAGQSAAACEVGTQKCVSCHMPRVAVPGAHFAFTDHYIRIVRPGEPYPD